MAEETTLPPVDAVDAPAEEGGSGGFGSAVAAALRAIARAVLWMVKGAILTILRLIPIALWLAALAWWGWSAFRLFGAVVQIYDPNNDIFALVTWGAVVVLINLPIPADMLLRLSRAAGGNRKKQFYMLAGALAVLGLVEQGGRLALLMLWQDNPLLVLAFPQLFLFGGAMLVASGKKKRRPRARSSSPTAPPPPMPPTMPQTDPEPFFSPAGFPPPNTL